MKDHLKARGYRWSDGSDGRPKSWWTEIGEEALDDELRYLRAEIYRYPDADPPIKHLTAFDRFRARLNPFLPTSRSSYARCAWRT